MVIVTWCTVIKTRSMLSSQCDSSSRTAVHVTQWCYSLWVMGRESHNIQGLRNGQLEAQLISPTPPTRLL